MATVETPRSSPVPDFMESEIVKRNLDRARRGWEVLVDRDAPPVGATPKDVIYASGTLRVYRYRPMQDEVYRVPLVLVMSLISKPYILDLSPGQSLVEYLLHEGFDVYMVDWGVPRPEDKRLGLEYYVLEALPRSIAEVQKVSEEEQVNIFGYCMGGLLALMYNGIVHDAPVANMVCAATPVDFNGMGLLRRWMDRRWFDVDRLVDTLGNVPADMLFRSFEMLRPAQRWAEYARLIDNLWNDMYVKNYRLFNRWVYEQIPFPGEAYRQFIKELMWENKLMKGELNVGGRPVDLRAVKAPVCHVLAEHDHIAPVEATRPLTQIVGSEETEDVVLKGGHVSLIAGRNAWFRLWPHLSEWLGERSV